MKITIILILFNTAILTSVQAQPNIPHTTRESIYFLIDKYSEARENKDTLLLKQILTPDVDQLVSNGEWRNDINSAVKGMLNSSVGSPGTRTLIIEKIRLFNPNTAIVDCRYEIENADGTIRKMWSSFITVTDKRRWKISAIRNMLPAGQ